MPTPDLTKKVSSDPKREERIAAIEHVVYEYANLISAAFHSMNAPAPVRTHSDDAFLLGYRKLGDFLMNDKRTKDDVLALDYVPTGSSRTWSLPTRDQTWREKMNKQLTHIAYDRVRAPHEWDHRRWLPILEKEFHAAWKMFLGAVTDADYKAEYEKQISMCRGKQGFTHIAL